MTVAATRSTAKTWGAVAGVLALAALLALAIRRGPPAAIPVLAPRTLTVVPGIHMLAGLGPSASYVVETSAGLVLVDSGLDEDAVRLKAEMERLGLDWRNIVAILLTHAHGDHAGGAERLQETTGAKVYAGQGDAAVLRAGGPRDAVFSNFPMPDHEAHPTRIDRELRGGEVLRFGDQEIEALALPGHSPGSICYLTVRDGLRVLFTGDVVMVLGGAKTVGTYSAYLPPRYRGDARTFLASLETLRAMPPPDLVLPGHPFTDPVPQSPQLAPGRWRAMIDDGLGEMKTLVARFEADGADFLDGHPKLLRSGLAYLGDRQGRAVYALTLDSRFYLVNAPGGSGLVEFVANVLRGLGLPFVQPEAILLTEVPEGTVIAAREVAVTAHCPVVAPVAEILDLKRAMPPEVEVLSADEWLDREHPAITSIPTPGRGRGAISFACSLEGKRVLFTGSVPILFDPESMAGLAGDLANNPAATNEYRKSIETLEAVAPDLWLPAVPSEGQNANLYDEGWREVLTNNREAVLRILETARRSEDDL